MDYCSSCRRHLNGALVCPGCGDYAPDIAPSAVAGPDVPMAPGAAAGAPVWQAPAEDTWYDGYFRDEAAPSADTEETEPVEPSADLEGVPAAPQGRAARRRQRARWKKNQRRAVVATAVALVGGGLTVMGMDRQSTDRTQAATAPDTEGLGGVEELGSQSGLTPDTQPDDARRTTDTPRSQSPSTDNSYGQSADQGSDFRQGTGTSPRTPSSTPSDRQQAQRGSSSAGDSADGTTDTPSDRPTTPPANDDSTGSGSGTDTSTGGDTSTGSDSATGTGTGTGSSDDTSGGGSDSGSDATSPSGLCLLGGVLCVS